MQRRAAAIAATAGAALLGGVLAAPSAQADPVLCLNVDVQVNDQGGAQEICLPPEGSETPELPPLPELPVRR